MKTRKFAEGGKPEGGRFDEDTYSRARRFVESGGKKEETKTAVKKARKVEVDPTEGEAKDKAAQRAADRMEAAEDRPTYKKTAGGIPIDPNPPKAPASTGEDTSGPSNVGRILSALGAGTGALGTAAAMRTAGHANRVAGRVAKAIDSAQTAGKYMAPRVGEAAKSAQKFSPKEELTAAESAMRGATTRSALQRKRAEQAADMASVGMKKGGKVAKYAAGGAVGSSASRRADGIATKGKTKCRMY